jgi:hypothetical protein
LVLPILLDAFDLAFTPAAFLEDKDLQGAVGAADVVFIVHDWLSCIVSKAAVTGPGVLCLRCCRMMIGHLTARRRILTDTTQADDGQGILSRRGLCNRPAGRPVGIHSDDGNPY